MAIDPYLHFSGDCEEALNFYAELFEGEVAFAMTYRESPMAEHMTSDWLDKVMHATLTIAGDTIFGCDSPPSMYKTPQGFSISFVVPTPEDAERIFGALSQEGNVTMSMEQTFFALRFGMVIDRFNIPWMIRCVNPENS